MASPLAKGLFHRAICESGTAIGGFSMGQKLAELEEMGVKFFARLGVDKADDPLKAARGLPFEKILEAREAMMKDSSGGMRMNMDNSAVDGWFLPKTPTEIFRSGEYNTVPLITMATMGEITGPGGLLLPQLIPAYTNMLEYHSRAGGKGYAAIFDHVPAKWRAEGAVAAHSMEALYLAFLNFIKQPKEELDSINFKRDLNQMIYPKNQKERDIAWRKRPVYKHDN